LPDLKKENFFSHRKAYLISSPIFNLWDLMTDLLLQDLDDLNKEARMRMLSNERREMLGDQKVVAKKRVVSPSRFGFFGGSFKKLRKAGRRN
jgi:hypothetical protein